LGKVSERTFDDASAALHTAKDTKRGR